MIFGLFLDFREKFVYEIIMNWVSAFFNFCVIMIAAFSKCSKKYSSIFQYWCIFFGAYHSAALFIIDTRIIAKSSICVTSENVKEVLHLYVGQYWKVLHSYMWQIISLINENLNRLISNTWKMMHTLKELKAFFNSKMWDHKRHITDSLISQARQIRMVESLIIRNS